MVSACYLIEFVEKNNTGLLNPFNSIFGDLVRVDQFFGLLLYQELIGLFHFDLSFLCFFRQHVTKHIANLHIHLFHTRPGKYLYDGKHPIRHLELNEGFIEFACSETCPEFFPRRVLPLFFIGCYCTGPPRHQKIKNPFLCQNFGFFIHPFLLFFTYHIY